MATLIEKAAEILARCETVVITSINQEGYPRPVPMSNIKSEGATTVSVSYTHLTLPTILRV